MEANEKTANEIIKIVNNYVTFEGKGESLEKILKCTICAASLSVLMNCKKEERENIISNTMSLIINQLEYLENKGI